MHTPLPWYACEHPEGPAGIRAPDHKMVARCEGMFGRGHVSRGDWEDNAAFIVRACNSHYDLVEALEKLTAFVDQTCAYVDANPLIEAARAALDRAKGD